MGAKLGSAFNCRGPCYAEVGKTWNLGCVALALSFFGFHSGRCLNCYIDWTVMLISSLLWEICSSLDSGLLATAVEVSKSCHNLTIKLLIQNSPFKFQDDTALSLHCKFQGLIFSDRGENVNSCLADWHTHTHDDYRMPPGLCPPRHNKVYL